MHTHRVTDAYVPLTLEMDRTRQSCLDSFASLLVRDGEGAAVGVLTVGAVHLRGVLQGSWFKFLG